MFDNFLIAIPAFNEEKNIEKLIINLIKKFKHIIVIDNCSSDKTYEIIKKLPIIFTKHEFNLGKSLSMKTCFDYAEIKNFRYIAYMDADGQHNVNDLIKLCKKIEEKKLDAVVGYRNNLKELNFKKRIGTLILEKIFKLLYRKDIKDIQSGLRVLKVSMLEKIRWESKGITHYFADAEITCKLIKNNSKIEQLPIETIASEPYKGMNIIQGIFLMTKLFSWRLTR
jgi:cellulose synthase/poly-beta-1,6-N-acetylglucosamine synthase-like glycosyltransferase